LNGLREDLARWNILVDIGVPIGEERKDCLEHGNCPDDFTGMINEDSFDCRY
jgi:hypothetical protein